MMLGYAFFGMVCFGSYSDRFESFSASMITLFAVLNGDVIRETFLNLDNGGFPVVSQLYMYSFICLFIYVVLNIFIAIIEEAFFSAWAPQQESLPQAQTRSPDENRRKSMAQKHSHDSPADVDIDGAEKVNRVARFAPELHSPLRREHSEPIQMASPTSMSSSESNMGKEPKLGRSWNRFRELLHNINQDELHRRHEELHATDVLMHEEIKRRTENE